MLKIAVCDDDQKDLSNIVSLINDYNAVKASSNTVFVRTKLFKLVLRMLYILNRILWRKQKKYFKKLVSTLNHLKV